MRVKKWQVRTHFEASRDFYGQTVIAPTREAAKLIRAKQHNSRPGAGKDFPFMSTSDLVASPVEEDKKPLCFQCGIKGVRTINDYFCSDECAICYAYNDVSALSPTWIGNEKKWETS